MKFVEISQYWQKNSIYLLNDLRNFNGIFRKDVTYDNFKSNKNQGFTLSLDDTILENLRWVGVKLTSTPHLLTRTSAVLLGLMSFRSGSNLFSKRFMEERSKSSKLFTLLFRQKKHMSLSYKAYI